MSSISEHPSEGGTQLPNQYFFRKLKSKIYALCCFSAALEQAGLKEVIQIHIMKCMFFTDGSYKNRFIHFINTKTEISLFLDKNSFDRFMHDLPVAAKQFINIDLTCFRAAEMYCIQNDINSPGITSIISSKLAANGISIVYTNSFNSSFILVPEKQFLTACSILKVLANPENDQEDEDPD